MQIWYEFKPSDTMFFRGSEPLEPGISYQTQMLFPPPPSVISGAMRTAVLRQKNISIKEYSRGHEVKELIGEYGKEAPFSVIGPILKAKELIYVPAPYTLYTEGNKYEKKMKVLYTEEISKQKLNSLGIKTSSEITHWVKHLTDPKTLGGNWISLDALKRRKDKLDTTTELLINPQQATSLFAVEERTGIAFDLNRKIKESQIYNAKHIRLSDDVTLIWGVDRECGLESEGVLTLGGEQRFGRYVKLDSRPKLPENGNNYLSLGPVPITTNLQNSLVATGKPVYMGGWDLKKQFHKTMRPHYPAGTVFSEKVHFNSIIF